MRDGAPGKAIEGLIVVTLVGVVVLTAISHYRKENPAPLSETQPLLEIATGSAGILERLNPNVLAAMLIYPQRLNSQISQALAWRERLVASSFWKKQEEKGLTEALGKAAEEQILSQGNSATSNESEALKFEEVEQFLREDWPEFEEFVFAVGVERVEITDKLKLPPAMAIAHFKSSRFPERIRKELISGLPFKKEKDGNFFSLDSDPNDKDRLLILARFGSQGREIKGSLIFKQNQILGFLLADSLAPFLVESDAPSLSQSAAWKELEKGTSSAPVFIGWWDQAELTVALSDFFRAMVAGDAQAEKGVNDFIDQMSNIQGERALLSVDASAGMVMRTCMRLSESSKLYPVYEQNLPKGGELLRNSSYLTQLLSAKTVFGLRVTGALIRISSQVYGLVYPKGVVDLVNQDKDLKPVLRGLKGFISALEEFQVTEISSSFAVTENVMLPEAAVAISHSRGKSSELLKSLHTVIEQFGPMPDGNPLSTFTDEGGGSLTFATPTVTISGRPVKEGSILFSPDGEARAALLKRMQDGSGTQSFVGSTVAGRDLVSEINGSDLTIFFSDRSLLGTLKGFAAMFGVSSGSADDQRAMEEFIELVSFDYASTQRSWMDKPPIVCSEAVSGLISK